jgi:nucleotide-binding universal stress UspA family protein
MIPKTIPEIKKILYCTDLSKNARYAFAYAASIANRYGAGITILHVLADISSYGDSLVINILGQKKWDELRKGNEEKLVVTIKERLEKFCEDVSAEMPACPFITDEIVVKIGQPVEEILKEVKRTDCDLVVMGSHGLGMIEDAVLGSTARRVFRRCNKPVLIIRLPEDDD